MSKKKKKTKSQKRWKRDHRTSVISRLIDLKKDCEIALGLDPEYYNHQEDLELFYQQILDAIEKWKTGDDSGMLPIRERFTKFAEELAHAG